MLTYLTSIGQKSYLYSRGLNIPYSASLGMEPKNNVYTAQNKLTQELVLFKKVGIRL